MFSEDQFIQDFIDINIHNTRFINLDLDDVKSQIVIYGYKKLSSYSREQLKFISELYYSYDEIKQYNSNINSNVSDVSHELYKELARNAINKLFPKIMNEYINNLDIDDINSDIDINDINQIDLTYD